MQKDIKIVIAGGRDFIDYKYLTQTMDAVIQNLKTKQYQEITIVSGTAKGADTLGEKYALSHDLKLEQYPADWNRLGKRAGFIRNEQMAQQAKLVIVFWDGFSSGTKNMIKIAHKYDRVVLVFRY